jgi:hypothetical protein
MIGLVTTLGALCAWKSGLALLADGLRAGGRGALQLVSLRAVVFLLTGFTEVLGAARAGGTLVFRRHAPSPWTSSPAPSARGE